MTTDSCSNERDTEWALAQSNVQPLYLETLSVVYFQSFIAYHPRHFDGGSASKDIIELRLMVRPLSTTDSPTDQTNFKLRQEKYLLSVI